jgi:2,3-bisphosphoglycerate-dependent phosphoglycerate mutase
MERTIYFVRHSEPDLNVIEDRQRPLTIEGHNRLKNIVSYFKDIEIDEIYSSPYKRCVDTVKAVAKEKALEITTVEYFKERKVTDGWIDDFKTYSTKQWKNFDYKLKNGESLNETRIRNVEALNEIMTLDWKTIVIGTHGTALSTILNHYFDDYGYEQFLEIKVEFPFVCKVEIDDNKFKSFQIIRTNSI